MIMNTDGKLEIQERVKEIVLSFCFEHRACNRSIGIDGNKNGKITIYHCNTHNQTVMFYTKAQSCQ